jgi:hypothetical protein
MTKEKIPNPGSEAATKAGCTCPVIDNHHGQGRPTSKSILWDVMQDCPLHGKDSGWYPKPKQ